MKKRIEFAFSRKKQGRGRRESASFYCVRPVERVARTRHPGKCGAWLVTWRIKPLQARQVVYFARPLFFLFLVPVLLCGRFVATARNRDSSNPE